jgi:hypothetical protein
MKNWQKWAMAIVGGVALAAALALAAVGQLRGGEALALAQGTIYVDVAATGANDGSSWEDAYTTLQPALDEAVAGDEIWVAAGTYTPTYLSDPSEPRSVTFQMKNGVALYGGFDPSVGDTEFGDRDWAANVTILSGERGDPGLADNAYHVVYNPAELALDETAMLDGFAITAGNANYLIPYHRGGGMYNNGSSPTVSHCTFTGNSAYVGGGMGNELSSPRVIDCTFTGNSADNGGGMSNFNASPIVTGCIFSENWVTQYYGGGMFNDHSSPTVTDCTFASNEAPDGGGMYSIESSLTVINCTFTGNLAEVGAGMMNYNNVVAVVTNCTFSGNTASMYAGGIFSGGNLPSTLIATNCILWGDSPGELAHSQGSTMTVTHSNIQGSLYPGAGNMHVDPLFRDAAVADFHLLPESPCIDEGSNEAEDLPDYDFEGDPRIVDGDGDGTAVADMGIDEVLVYALTIGYAGNGSGLVDLDPGGGLYDPGTVVTLTAVADRGSSFTEWSGDAVGTTNPITLTMDTDKQVTATFMTYRVYLPMVVRSAP